MAEKLLEEILLDLPNESEDSYKKWLYEKFRKSSSTTEATAITCTLEEFAIFYLGMVKSQTDEFIRSNTSTCNTPHKIHQSTIETDVTESLLHDNKKKVLATNVDGASNKNGKGEMRFNKRQISRELFVNQDSSQMSEKNDNDNNRPNNIYNEFKGRNNSNGFGNRQSRKIFLDSSSSSFSEFQSPQIGSEYPIAHFTSTPGNNSTCSNATTRANKSMDGAENITNTSTPNSSYFNTKSSLSFDQSSMVNRGCGNSSRRSFDANSGYKNNLPSRRNTSSPFCLGDFINTSNTSNTSGRGSKKKNHSGTATESTPKFTSSDFPALKQNANNSGESKVQQAAKSNSNNSNEIVKPKKRVMPITVSRKISTDSSNFISSSFHSENNLLSIATLEADESIPVIPEREILREHRDAISKDFSVEKKPIRNLHTLIKENLPVSPISLSSPIGQNPFAGSLISTPHKSVHQYDEGKVERQDLLIAMARIYSFLIDANHVPNILSEFSYIFNLLNTELNPYEHQTQNYSQMKFIDIASNLLKNFHNCIFFSMCILNHQKQILGTLDCTTIRVICDYERIQTITPSLYEYLLNIMQKKTQIDSAIASQRTKSDTNNINKVVFYQQETDNRDNFPSDREFGAFKKQRDMFYTILRSWELKHLDPSWDFRRELGVKVRGLLTLLEHPINMAHLAKLFTAQLIISCNFDNELQMALPNIDLSKLSKLRQRLVAPSLFSTQYLFPGNQAFFRDFIICCDFHMMFIEQLKIALISELLQMNDSSLETLSITRGNVNNNAAASTSNDDDDDGNKEKNFQQEFIVRAETISTMRVIGKFIGFVVSRLYSYDGYRNSLVDQKQMSIRNLISPDFDVKSILQRAIDGRKLLVTIPWLVEYLTMLDFITIRLDYYREVFQILYTLYMRTNTIDGHESSICVMPQSKFIIRTCLGWLFEHPSIPEDYYNSSMMINLNVTSAKCSTSNDIVELNPHLENAIHSSCPFLADFRVSMMPQRITKAVSRTGRYRHITTKIQDKVSTSSTNLKTQGNHERLIEAFLASQSLSVRKIVDFTIDRVTSAVIKDFQVRHLLSIRKEARNCVEMEVSNIKKVDDLKKKMREIFYQHYERLLNQWNDEILSNSKKRIEASFDALLPIETLNDVKKTLINITIEKTNSKLQHWRTTNISIEIFSKDIHVDAMKLMENYQQNLGNSTTNKRTSSNMIIDLSSEIHPSEYFQLLQMHLHHASSHAEKVSETQIIKLFDLSMNVLDKQTLPTNAYRNIAFYILQLMLLLIANRPELITKDLLFKLFVVWHHEKLLNFTTPLKEKSLEENAEADKELKSSQSQQNNRLKVNNFVFCNVISSRFILTMHGKDRKNFEVYGNFLIELIKEKFISVEDINEVSIGLYKYEWNKNTLSNIAFLIQHVKSSLPPSKESAQSHLFMELVADLAMEMENF